MPPCETMKEPAFSKGFMVDVLVMSNVPSAFCSTRKLFLLVKYIFFISIPLIRVAVGLKIINVSFFLLSVAKLIIIFVTAK